MRFFVRLGMLALIIPLLLISCDSSRKTAQGGTIKTAGFDFKLESLRGGQIALSDYRDKQPVILFFWTSECPYCRSEFKTLNEKYPELLKEGIELLAIDVGEPRQIVADFVKRHYVAFPVLLDKDADVAMSMDLLGVPTYIFINKKGGIVHRGNQFSPRSYKDLF